MIHIVGQVGYNAVGDGFDGWSSVQLYLWNMIIEFMLDTCFQELSRSYFDILNSPILC